MAQSVHAAFAFQHDHPELTADWLKRSNYLVIVAVEDEAALLDLVAKAADFLRQRRERSERESLMNFPKDGKGIGPTTGV